MNDGILGTCEELQVELEYGLENAVVSCIVTTNVCAKRIRTSNSNARMREETTNR